jgi:uncharacterized protein YjeT (DUF2065 family)
MPAPAMFGPAMFGPAMHALRERKMWHDLMVALCLVLVIEGILPFIAPKRWRRMLMKLDEIDDTTMRLIGLGSMLTGTVLLQIIN